MFIWSILMPHPPVLIPEVGRGRENEAAKTLQGISRLTERIKHSKPDLLVVLSPHQSYMPGALLVNSAEFYSGSFAMFGVPGVRITAYSPANDVINSLCDYLVKSGVNIYKSPESNITEDQGSLVPLYFLNEAWGSLPPLIIASPIGLTPEGAYKLGKALADYHASDKIALLASGDLSHRLTPDAPAGYEPEFAKIFETAIEDSLRTCSAEKLLSLDKHIISRAGECGFRSVLAMLGLCEGHGNIEIFSHEWPFGVGYCNALCMLNDNSDNSNKRKNSAPVILARETVKRLLTGEALPQSGSEVIESDLWDSRKSCFVSIKKTNGELRGCIGTLSPVCESLDKEIIANAVSSSTRDPRFPPMTSKELDDVIFSVDVLSEPEAISNYSELDVKKFGVIVSQGYRRGVLLPDLEGVDSVEQQIQIAAMKAGIRDLSNIALERFEVGRYR
ncbi:MAG: AmmeMemoRadiSam system protein A [Synergistaceae bacterium]|nr:AmmeMemoRadiSam system protein A [Synergistaceae bacterium]